jgi:hypothetical protein
MFNHSGIDVESLICRVMWLSITHRAVSSVVLTTLSRPVNVYVEANGSPKKGKAAARKAGCLTDEAPKCLAVFVQKVSRRLYLKPTFIRSFFLS